MTDFLDEKLKLDILYGPLCEVVWYIPGRTDEDRTVFQGLASDCLRYIDENGLPLDGDGKYCLVTNQGEFNGYNFSDIAWKMGYQPIQLEAIVGVQKNVDRLIGDAHEKAASYNEARKLEEHTYGNHIFMRLEVDGEVHEVSNYAGVDERWDTFKTTADGTEKREAVIRAFEELY